jgi:hypothetical protein
MSDDWLEAGVLDVLLELGSNEIVIESIAEDYMSESYYIVKIQRGSGSGDDYGLVAPQAWYVKIANDDDFYTGKTLTGEYEFFDELGREESGTTYQWYRQADNEGSGRAAIDGATGLSYTLTADDKGKYIYFTVTPKAEGSIAADTEESWWIGPVMQVDDTATSITGISVTYNDEELLTDFDTQQKTYTLEFQSESDSSMVSISVTGDAVEINGVSTYTDEVDFYENSLIEVRDTSAESSYYISLSDMSYADTVDIFGEGTITVSSKADSLTIQKAIAYDQYGDELTDIDFEWCLKESIMSLRVIMIRCYRYLQALKQMKIILKYRSA